MDEIIRPTVRAMADADMPYSGVLYAGLMLTAQGPKLIEYNARFGDPECQVLMMRLESDLVDLLLATAQGRLAALGSVTLSDKAARSEEHTSELQSLMRSSYAVFCLKKQKRKKIPD